MKIEVRFFAVLENSRSLPHHDYFNKTEIPSGTTVNKLLKQMHIHHELPKMILLNGIKAQQEELLQEGDIVSVFS
jgi:molybdopterin converting factor small subunit